MKMYFQKIRELLKGKKTYLGLLACSVYALGIVAGWWESNEYMWILIATWTGVSFRASVAGK